MRIGLFIAEAGVDGSDVKTVVEQARWAEAHGFSTGWVPHIPWSLDGLTSLALAGQVTERIELGTAVMQTWSRHPYAMAQQAFTTQAAVGGRLVLGLGPSHPEWVANAYGMSYDRPLRHVREYLSVLESAFLLHGQVDFVGETYRSTSVLNVPGARDVPILLAALGPGMLQLAGERTSGTITWMGDERAHAEHVVPRITAAAESAGRPVPRVVAGLPVAVCDDAAAGRAEAAVRFAIYGEIPTYARMLARGDADGPADVCVVGTEREVEERLRSYATTGITDLLAAVFPVGDDDQGSRKRTLDFLASLTPQLGVTVP
jgi:F420-dependent oxidoreductase-like protein